MAVLKTDTFGSEKNLLQRVKQALTRLTGAASGGPNEYRVAPTKLDADRDLLRSDYKLVWKQCTVEYDEKEAGAEIHVSDLRIVLGPFMKHFGVTDLEKVILHEFLHAALDEDWQKSGEQAQHGQINQIIKYNIGYSGAPNPANPTEG